MTATVEARSGDDHGPRSAPAAAGGVRRGPPGPADAARALVVPPRPHLGHLRHGQCRPTGRRSRWSSPTTRPPATSPTWCATWPSPGGCCAGSGPMSWSPPGPGVALPFFLMAKLLGRPHRVHRGLRPHRQPQPDRSSLPTAVGPVPAPVGAASASCTARAPSSAACTRERRPHRGHRRHRPPSLRPPRALDRPLGVGPSGGGRLRPARDRRGPRGRRRRRAGGPRRSAGPGRRRPPPW